MRSTLASNSGFRFFRHSLFILAIIHISVGCHRLKIDRPAENYLPTSYSPRYSHISIPVETDGGTLKKLINREIKGLIYADTSFADNGNDNLMLRASRGDSIDLSIDRNQISYRVPLKIWLRKKIPAGILGIDLSSTHNATAEVALKFKTTISLNKDWGIQATTLSDGFEWISYPQVMVGLMKIPLPVIGDLLVEENMPLITREIDQSIKASFNLRNNMSDAWIAMQKPVLISPENALWLKISPVEISTVPIAASGNSIRHTISMKALIQVYFGNEPKAEINRILPPLKITSAIPDHFTINFSLDIPFARINEVAGKQFKGYVYNYSRYSITVQDIALYGQGENLIVALYVDGSVRGAIYLAGKPVFDKGTNSIRFENLDYSISTKNVLVKTASWLFKSGLIRKISESLVFPFGDQLADARNEIGSYLRKSQTLNYLEISGELLKLDADKILISQEALKTYFELEGKVRVRIAE